MIYSDKQLDFIHRLISTRIGRFEKDKKEVTIKNYECRCGCYIPFVYYNECPKCGTAIATPKGVKWKCTGQTGLAYECYMQTRDLAVALTRGHEVKPKTTKLICHALDVSEEEFYAKNDFDF